MERLTLRERLHAAAGNTLRYVRYLDDFPAFPLTQPVGRHRLAASPTTKIYVVQTNTKVVERCLLMTTDPGDLVLDPTCGSGTTAYVAEQWGRRWITIDTSRVALALARTRLMAARYPVLPAGRLARRACKKEAELTGKTPPPTTRPTATSARASSTSACRTSRSSASPTTRTSREGMTRDADRRRHRPPRRDRDALRPALRRQQARPRDRAVHGREPVAAPRALDRRGTTGRRGRRPEAAEPRPTSRR